MDENTQSPALTAEPHDGASASRIRDTRIEKLKTIRELGVNPYPYKFEKTHPNQALQDQYRGLADGEETG